MREVNEVPFGITIDLFAVSVEVIASLITADAELKDLGR
jgi:hypothetical protein